MFDCFLFKQKTAYEMRISDWSSDVCSSDLLRICRELASQLRARRRRKDAEKAGRHPGALGEQADRDRRQRGLRCRFEHHGTSRGQRRPDLARDHRIGEVPRSEEQTSELQSLMRISYAVFCLKKKIQPNTKLE